MSVFKVHGQCSWPPWSVFMVHVVRAHGPCGQCSWPPQSVFMFHVVSADGHNGSVHFDII